MDKTNGLRADYKAGGRQAAASTPAPEYQITWRDVGLIRIQISRWLRRYRRSLAGARLPL